MEQLHIAPNPFAKLKKFGHAGGANLMVQRSLSQPYWIYVVWRTHDEGAHLT